MHAEMSFLIDSNIVIAAEPFNGQLESLQPQVSTFLRIAAEHGHRVYVHPATRDDLNETIDPVHRKQNMAAFAKYPSLTELEVPQKVLAVFPVPRSPNDDRDARILAALAAGAVHFLVTNDEKLRKRAVRLGHEPKVLRADEAAVQLATWHPDAPPPPPSVQDIKTYTLNSSDLIFESLRETYADFEGWIEKVKKESSNRRAWVVRDVDGTYAALAIVKMRDVHPISPGSEAIKLSTLKVGDAAGGRRLGELLIKAVLRWTAEEPNRPSSLFVEVDANQDRLQGFLTDFGFSLITTKDGRPTEQVWLKELDPPLGSDLNGLDHHRAFGPPALRAGQPIYVIPITPEWYEDLFPDAEVFGHFGAIPLAGSDPDPRAHGNAIRKAYLCRSPTKSIPEGSLLLFYRSQGTVRGDGAIVAVGVTEKSHKSSDPFQTIELSFKRTVYSEADVGHLHQDGREVLTILFRHDRFVSPSWSISLLLAHRVVSSWPQSVTRVRNPGGIAWVENQLAAWP